VARGIIGAPLYYCFYSFPRNRERWFYLRCGSRPPGPTAFSYMKKIIAISSILVLTACYALALAQETRSIGGKEHDDNILGVKIGMSVPEALEAVFVNANRKPGREKPDALRHEGRDNQDIRVFYNDLKAGKLQIVFAEGKWVREIALVYASPRPVDELRLPLSSNISVAMGVTTTDIRSDTRIRPSLNSFGGVTRQLRLVTALGLVLFRVN